MCVPHPGLCLSQSAAALSPVTWRTSTGCHVRWHRLGSTQGHSAQGTHGGANPGLSLALGWVRPDGAGAFLSCVCVRGTLQGPAQEKVLAVLRPRKVWEEGSLPLGVRSQEALAPTLSLRLRVRMCD